jgi:cytochrome c oxidase assembly protein subunit 11
MAQPSLKKANRKLTWQLWLFAAGSLAFGFALVPLYNVLCEVTGYGDRSKLQQAASVVEVPDATRTVTIEGRPATTAVRFQTMSPTSSTPGAARTRTKRRTAAGSNGGAIGTYMVPSYPPGAAARNDRMSAGIGDSSSIVRRPTGCSKATAAACRHRRATTGDP